MRSEVYAANIFLNSVLPVLKEIINRTDLKKKFVGKSGVVQISTKHLAKTLAMHFIFKEGDIEVALGTHKKPDIELAFKNLKHFNGFFRGTSKKLPRIKGIFKIGLLVPFFQSLLKMASLLGAKEAPADQETKELLTRCLFYLLSSGISQLNKLEHPDVKNWSMKSPDRVYAFAVDGYEDLGAYLRVKAGKTKSSRGYYKRSQPFFTMRFADVDSALQILLQTGDLLDLTAKKKLIMEGAPEFGAMIGDFMMLVGGLIQA
ncbi:hypothetical protein [Guggenheimella bovis]